MRPAAPAPAPDTGRSGAPAAGRHARITPFAAAFALSGIALRIGQYLHNRSLSLDEAALALNIRERTLAGLLAPLDSGQTAPVGFLWIQKALLLAFGDSDLALRAVPLLAGIASVPLFMLLARRVLPANLLAPAIALFAFSQYPIYWASDAKPYSLDLAACLALLLLALRFVERPGEARRGLALGAAGAVAPWLSHASVLVLAGLSLRLAWAGWRGRPKEIVRIAALWAIGLPAAWLAVRGLGPGNEAYFRAFWHQGFLPLPWRPGALDAWRATAFRTVFDPLGYRGLYPSVIAMAAIAGGVAWLVARRGSTALLLVLPVAVTLAASLAQRYPMTAQWEYSGRVVLFLAPCFCLFVMAGAAWIPRRRLSTTVATFLAMLVAVPSLAALPYSRGDVRPALDYVAAHAREGDVVYLYYGIRQTADWYRRPIRGRIVPGVCAQTDREGYVRDLERLRGAQRFWLVLGYDFFLEHELFLTYMSANARLLEASDSLHNARARLYDFSGGVHAPLPAALLVPGVVPDPDTDCRGVFAPPRPAQASRNQRTSSASVGRLPVERMPIR